MEAAEISLRRTLFQIQIASQTPLHIIPRLPPLCQFNVSACLSANEVDNTRISAFSWEGAVAKGTRLSWVHWDQRGSYFIDLNYLL